MTSVIHVSRGLSDLLIFVFSHVPCSKISGATTLITRENPKVRDRDLMMKAKRLV